MIDERHEELASLYAFDLLEGDELAQFETALARDLELQALVRELRQTSATLAYTAPSHLPPPALKQRLLATVSQSSRPAATADNVIRPSFNAWNVIPWAAAACFAIGAAFLGQRYLASQSEIALLRDQNALVKLAVQTVEQQLEADRIISRRQLSDAQQQLTGLNTQLGDARTQVTDRDRLIAEARNQLADRERQIAERDRQLADSRSQLANREQQVATLTQRVGTLGDMSAQIDRQLGEAKQRVAVLTEELKAQGDLANLKITALASMLKNSPQALAVAVWDPKKQEGMVAFEKLPPLTSDQKLEFWVVEATPGAKPVSAGVLNVSADGTGRLRFKPATPVTAIAAFAVSREKNDGATSHASPAEVIMLGHSR